MLSSRDLRGNADPDQASAVLTPGVNKRSEVRTTMNAASARYNGARTSHTNIRMWRDRRGCFQRPRRSFRLCRQNRSGLSLSPSKQAKGNL